MLSDAFPYALLRSTFPPWFQILNSRSRKPPPLIFSQASLLFNGSLSKTHSSFSGLLPRTSNLFVLLKRRVIGLEHLLTASLFWRFSPAVEKFCYSGVDVSRFAGNLHLRNYRPHLRALHHVNLVFLRPSLYIASIAAGPKLRGQTYVTGKLQPCIVFPWYRVIDNGASAISL